MIHTLILGSLISLLPLRSDPADGELLQATPGSLWHLALDHSRELKAGRVSTESAGMLYRGSGRLPDPMLRLGYSPSPLETRNGPVDFTVTVSQKIPWPGGLTYARDRMGYMADAASLEETIASLRLRTEIAALWASLYRTRRTSDVLGGKIERLEHLMELADVRYRSGQTGLSILLAIENRTAVLEARLHGTELEIESLLQEMSSLLGVDGISLAWPDSIPREDFFEQGVSTDLDVAEMPLVRMSIAEVMSGQAEAEAVRASLYPGFEVGATWSVIGEPDVEMGSVEPGRDGLTVFAGLNLPLGYSGSSENLEAAVLSSTASDYMHLQLEADQTAQRQRLVNRVLSLLEMYRAYEETVIPNSRGIYQLAVTEWVSGRTGIETVLDRLSELEDAELEEIRIYSEIVSTYAMVLEIEGRNTEEGEFL